MSSATLPTTIRNDDVYAEGSATWELGTAVNIYKNRASVDIAYYQKRKYDGLEYAEISSASGYYNNYINSDTEYTKKGWEVTLNTTPYKTKELTWDVAFNWTTYATYYTALDELIEDHPWIDEGKRTDAYVTYDYQYDPSGNIIHRNGVPLYSLYPSNIGYSDPDWIWGITNRVSYKNWDASISIDGRVGGLTKTVTEMYMWRSGSHPKSVVPERYLDATV